MNKTVNKIYIRALARIETIDILLFCPGLYPLDKSFLPALFFENSI